MTEIEAAYIAGLFDGEGCVTYKKYMKKRTKKEKAYSTWSIELEISMTDQSIIRWLHEVLKVGSVSKKPPHKTSMGRKMQWRWRCSYRDAYYVCLLIWPFAHIKLPKIDKILKHYDNLLKNNVVDIRDYHRRSFK